VTEISRPDSIPPVVGAHVAVAAPDPGSHETSTRRKVMVLLGAAAVMLFIYFLPEPAALERDGNIIPLTMAGKACLAVMAFAVILWVTETLPFAATGLMILLLLPAFGVTDFRALVRAGFGDAVIAFFIGVLILSAGFTTSGLGTRLAYKVVSWVGTRTDRVLFGFLFVGGTLSWWVTDMACAAMMLPIALGLARDAGLRPGHSNFGRALFIAVAFGPLIGGIATPAGTAANIVAVAQLQQLAGVTITFTQWMVLGAPASLLMLPVAWRILLWVFPPELERLPVTDAEVRNRLAALGPLSRLERHTLVAFGAAVTLWTMGPLLSGWTGGAFAPPRRSGRARRGPLFVSPWRPRAQLEAGRRQHRMGRPDAYRGRPLTRPRRLRNGGGAVAGLGAAR